MAGGVKSGIIGEVGMDHPMHPNEEKVLRASAKASVATGVALSVHPGFNPASPFDIVRVVDGAGGDLSRTVIDHCDSRFNTSAGTNVFDSGPLLELAKSGGIWRSTPSDGKGRSASAQRWTSPTTQSGSTG